MTWTAPSTAVTGVILTAALWNTDVRDNTLHLYNNYLPLAGGTMTGETIFADQLATRPLLKDYAESVSTDADSGAAHTIDLENGNVHDLTLTAACTLTFSNPPASGRAGSFTLLLRQDGTGSRTVTWPGSVDWTDGTAPELSTAAGALDVLTFLTVDGGTTWLGFAAGPNMS